ncbi:hypothetical protein [Spirosoma rhododendri]|uniref:hypothetical protein n=1 Tax=Spirosoma rhododendri TaxID=2728024 RepID=UPI002FCDB364
MTLKTAAIGIFLVLLFWVQWVNFRYDPYKQPAQKGLSELRGNYAVTEFRLNNQLVPESPSDTVRWQEATFENWSTLTFKVNRPTPLDLSNGGGSPMRDLNRTFELTGVGGGQRMFYYDADSTNHVLYLQDKYRPQSDRSERLSADLVRDKPKKKQKPAADWIPADARARIGDEDAKIDALARSTRRTKGIKSEADREDGTRKHMVLHYQTTDGSHVVLTGVSETNDSIRVVLDRVQRNYALSKSTLNAGAY